MPARPTRFPLAATGSRWRGSLARFTRGIGRDMATRCRTRRSRWSATGSSPRHRLRCAGSGPRRHTTVVAPRAHTAITPGTSSSPAPRSSVPAWSKNPQRRRSSPTDGPPASIRSAISSWRSPDMDPVTLSVIGHAFAATAEEMGVNLYRSAHSTIVREVRDIATAVLDPHGTTVAIANYIPQLLNAMDPAAAAVAAEYDFADLQNGEAFVLNDPFHGGQHVNDVLLFTPIRDDGQLLGVACANVHHLDVGGGAAASNARATDVFQEGIVFPPMRIPLDDNWRRSPFGKFLGANVRAPRTVLADFDAQIAACRTGETRVRALARKYGPDAIKEFMVEVQAYAERISRDAIGAIPDGVYRGEAFMEDDGT